MQDNQAYIEYTPTSLWQPTKHFWHLVDIEAKKTIHNALDRKWCLLNHLPSSSKASFRSFFVKFQGLRGFCSKSGEMFAFSGSCLVIISCFLLSCPETIALQSRLHRKMMNKVFFSKPGSFKSDHLIKFVYKLHWEISRRFEAKSG